MALNWQMEADRTMVVRLNGMLGFDEFKATQGGGDSPLIAASNLKVLIIAEDFQGWQDGAWESVGFDDAIDANIFKMAVVIDPKWHDEIGLFLAKGLRSFPIQCFASEQLEQARGWLAEN